MSIGERIAQLRQDVGMSQYELAKAMSISRQAVSKWENDQSAPDTINLIRLCNVLNTDVEYLATGKKSRPSEPLILNKIETIEKIVEVEKVVKVPQIVTVERIINVPKIIEKPVLRLKYRNKYIRNPLEFLIVGIVCLILGVVIGQIL